MKYLYYGLFKLNEDNQYEVSFPDFGYEGATYGNSMAEALKSAHDALTLVLLDKEDCSEELPNPSEPQKIENKDNALIIPIEVNTTIEREKEENKYVKKTLTIPKYLNTLGKEKGINFSELLAKTLKEKLEV